MTVRRLMQLIEVAAVLSGYPDAVFGFVAVIGSALATFLIWDIFGGYLQ